MKTWFYGETALDKEEKWFFLLALFGCALSILPLPLMFMDIWPLSLSVPLLVSPSILLLFGLGIYARRYRTGFFAQRYGIGFLGGFIATLFYDGFRLFGLYWHFKGFDIIHKFGMLITGLNEFTWFTASVGWLYHFMNGGVFGITYALLWGVHGNVYWGIFWGLLLELGMLASYPKYFGMNMALGTPALTFSLLGHVAYGAVLGYLVQRRLVPKEAAP